MTMMNCSAEDFANDRLNPTYRTVQNWHDKWRATHLGPRTGQGVIIGTLLYLSVYRHYST